MASKFDTKDHFESMNHKKGEELNINNYNVGKAAAAMTSAFIKSAEIMATFHKVNEVNKASKTKKTKKAVNMTMKTQEETEKNELYLQMLTTKL